MKFRRLAILALAFAPLGMTALTPGTASAGVTAFGPVINNSAGKTTVTGRHTYCGSKTFHGALDLAAPCGKHLRSMLNGTHHFKYTRTHPNACRKRTTGHGNRHVVTGKNGYSWMQNHANHDPRFGKTGYFKRGQALNLVGGTGNATGPHVHATNILNWNPVSTWFTSFYAANSKCGAHPSSSSRIGIVKL